MIESINRANDSLETLDRRQQYAEWLGVLGILAGRDGVHSLVRGRCCRILFEKQKIDGDELQRLASLALSSAVPYAQAAAWTQGVLHGSGQLMLSLDGLWKVLDQWLSELQPDKFVELLPLLRRAFSGFSRPERRMMGEKARHLHHAPGSSLVGGAESADLDHERAGLVLPVLARILSQRSQADQEKGGS